jgi:hypothetical protein
MNAYLKPTLSIANFQSSISNLEMSAQIKRVRRPKLFQLAIGN